MKQLGKDDLQEIAIMDISIVIPNLNGEEFLEECFSSILNAFKVYHGNHEILFVDNDSTDKGIFLTKSNFPMVKIVQMGWNSGFAGACNKGGEIAKNRLILLLNNDTSVKEDFLFPLVRHFEDNRSLFAVSCKLMNWDRKTFQLGRRYLHFEHGLITLFSPQEDLWNEACPTFAITGSACLVDREKFLTVGGIGPFNRANDTDLSYRARKRGWEIIYEPESVVYHFGMATDNRLWASSDIKAIHRKEALLLIWRNFTNPALICEHIKNYPVLASRKMWGKKVFIKSFIEAIRFFPHVIENWKRNVRYSKLTDKQLINLLPAKDLQYN